jgi:Bacterial protein of unknown function (DUF899)
MDRSQRDPFRHAEVPILLGCIRDRANGCGAFADGCGLFAGGSDRDMLRHAHLFRSALDPSRYQVRAENLRISKHVETSVNETEGKGEVSMSNVAHPPITSRSEWLAERKKLLEAEKKLTKQYDEVNALRRRLPMVKLEKAYVFDGPNGKARLLDLFEGRRQLIIYHFMFDPDWDSLLDRTPYGRQEDFEDSPAGWPQRPTYGG